jgi:hypothetical protein
MRFRPIVSDGLTDLKRLKLPYKPGTDDKTDDQRGDRRVNGSECDVAKDVERGKRRMEWI